MYRPEGWEEIKKQPSRPDLFEAGADAMLEGLKKQKDSQPSIGIIYTDKDGIAHPYNTGIWVLIPEEE